MPLNICSSHGKYKKTLIYKIKLQNEPNQPQPDQEAKVPSKNIFRKSRKYIILFYSCTVLPSSRLESYIKDSVAGSDPPFKYPTIKDVFMYFLYFYSVLKNCKTSKQTIGTVKYKAKLQSSTALPKTLSPRMVTSSPGH